MTVPARRSEQAIHPPIHPSSIHPSYSSFQHRLSETRRLQHRESRCTSCVSSWTRCNMHLRHQTCSYRRTVCGRGAAIVNRRPRLGVLCLSYLTRSLRASEISVSLVCAISPGRGRERKAGKGEVWGCVDGCEAGRNGGRVRPGQKNAPPGR